MAQKEKMNLHINMDLRKKHEELCPRNVMVPNDVIIKRIIQERKENEVKEVNVKEILKEIKNRRVMK